MILDAEPLGAFDPASRGIANRGLVNRGLPTSESQSTSRSSPAATKTETAWFDGFAKEYTGEAVGDEDWTTATTQLGCEVSAIKAIATVESGVLGAFWKAGWPTILYERHLFSQETARKFDKGHPDISSRSGYRWATANEKKRGLTDDMYAWTQAANYSRLEQAYGLDQSAALKSASWGRFQIIGKNHSPAGFSSVEVYVKAMCASEKEQLRGFINFLKADANLLKALQKKDWAGFAKIYNGANYAMFRYDTRMSAAYAKEVAAHA